MKESHFFLYDMFEAFEQNSARGRTGLLYGLSAPEQNSWTSRDGFLYGIFKHSNRINKSYWIYVWYYGAPEQNMSVSRAGFLCPNRIHVRLVVGFCIAV